MLTEVEKNIKKCELKNIYMEYITKYQTNHRAEGHNRTEKFNSLDQEERINKHKVRAVEII